MKNEELFSRMHDLCKEIDKHYKKDPSDADEEKDGRAAEPIQDEEPHDPKIERLIQEAWKIQKQLDPIVRETMRDNPEALAEWDKIMHMCVADGLDPDEPDPDEVITIGDA